jgi:hypothetical protein
MSPERNRDAHAGGRDYCVITSTLNGTPSGMLDPSSVKMCRVSAIGRMDECRLITVVPFAAHPVL